MAACLGEECRDSKDDCASSDVGGVRGMWLHAQLLAHLHGD